MCGMRILKLGAFPYLLLLAVQRGDYHVGLWPKTHLIPNGTLGVFGPEVNLVKMGYGPKTIIETG